MKEIYSIQYLRAMAALMVVISHVGVQLGRLGYYGNWPDFLNAGVDIFFVISGFIMWVTTTNKTVTPLQFSLRRIARIVPLYWMITTAILISIVLFPHLLDTKDIDILYVVKSYIFFPALNTQSNLVQPLLGQGWTLNYEMFFYAIFAACLILPEVFRAPTMIGILVVVACLGVLFPDPRSIGGFYTSGIILEFGFGILIGVLTNAQRRFWPPLGPTLVVIGVLGVVFSAVYVPRAVRYGIPASMIVLGSVLLERSYAMKKIAVLQLLGDASYSIYLSHGIVLSRFERLWLKFGVINSWGALVMFAVASVLLASVAGVFLYRLVERPLIGIFRRRKPEIPGEEGHATGQPKLDHLDPSPIRPGSDGT